MKELQVVSLEEGEAGKSKFNRVTSKLVEHCRFSEPFCLMNDDMIMTKPHLFGAYRYLVGESFEAKIARLKNEPYRKFLLGSISHLPMKGKGPDFCLHTPFLVPRPYEIAEAAPRAKNRCLNSFSFRQFVGEYEMKDREPQLVLTKDNKVNEAVGINKNLNFGPVISFGPKGWTPENRDTLLNIYGAKSSFEEYSVI